VWLLQADGTAIPQSAEPGICWVGSFGHVNDQMIFTFTRVQTNQVTGIVLRYLGKLYCKEIDSVRP
jgi:hypothetical protein